jgi:hypothetical protein
MNTLVEISVQELKALEARTLWADALDMSGVDNWDGYEEAVKLYKEWFDEAA